VGHFCDLTVITEC